MSLELFSKWSEIFDMKPEKVYDLIFQVESYFKDHAEEDEEGQKDCEKYLKRGPANSIPSLVPGTIDVYREGLQRLKAALANTHLKTRLESTSVVEILELLRGQFSALNETFVFCLDTEEKLNALSVGPEYVDVNALYRES